MTPEASQADHDTVPAYSWYALGVLALVYMLNFIDRQILSILANDIKADLAIGDAELGFLYGTAFAIFYALFGIPLGRLADSANRVRLLGLGLALWSVMTALSGMAKNLGQLTVARIGVGVGEASANPCAYSLIADWFPRRLRATAISIYSAGLFIGSGLSLWLGGFVVESWNAAFPQDVPLGLAGWQAAFLAVGLPGVLLALWVVSLREPEREVASSAMSPWRLFAEQCLTIIPPFTLIAAARRGHRELMINLAGGLGFALVAFGLTTMLGNAEQFALVAIGYYALFSWSCTLRAGDRETFARTWGSTAFVAIIVLYAAISFVGYAVTYWASPYAERAFELAKTDLGLLIGAPNALGGFLGVLLGGWLADRLDRRFASGRVLAATGAVLLPVPLVLLGYSSDSLPLFLLCNFLTQMTTPTALGALAAASQALVEPRMRGTATAIFLIGPTLIGLAFGPFMAGYISEASGSLGLGVMTCLVAAIPGLIALLVAVKYYSPAR